VIYDEYMNIIKQVKVRLENIEYLKQKHLTQQWYHDLEPVEPNSIITTPSHMTSSSPSITTPVPPSTTPALESFQNLLPFTSEIGQNILDWLTAFNQACTTAGFDEDQRRLWHPLKLVDGTKSWYHLEKLTLINYNWKQVQMAFIEAFGTSNQIEQAAIMLPTQTAPYEIEHSLEGFWLDKMITSDDSIAQVTSQQQTLVPVPQYMMVPQPVVMSQMQNDLNMKQAQLEKPEMTLKAEKMEMARIIMTQQVLSEQQQHCVQLDNLELNRYRELIQLRLEHPQQPSASVTQLETTSEPSGQAVAYHTLSLMPKLGTTSKQLIEQQHIKTKMQQVLPCALLLLKLIMFGSALISRETTSTNANYGYIGIELTLFGMSINLVFEHGDQFIASLLGHNKIEPLLHWNWLWPYMVP
ncbi:unnamed protein product, partial [Didymodactylos carnosus]